MNKHSEPEGGGPTDWRLPDGIVPLEPSAQNREFAKEARRMFLALMDEQFTERQALAIIGSVISGAMSAGDEGEDA